MNQTLKLLAERYAKPLKDMGSSKRGSGAFPTASCENDAEFLVPRTG